MGSELRRPYVCTAVRTGTLCSPEHATHIKSKKRAAPGTSTPTPTPTRSTAFLASPPDIVIHLQESPLHKRFLARIQLTLHATRLTPNGTSRLVQAIAAWLEEAQRAPSPHSRVARFYVRSYDYGYARYEYAPPLYREDWGTSLLPTGVPPLP